MNKVFGDNYCDECNIGNGCHCKQIFGVCRKKLPCMKESKPRPLSFVCILTIYICLTKLLINYEFFKFSFPYSSTKSLRITEIQNYHGSIGIIDQ